VPAAQTPLDETVDQRDETEEHEDRHGEGQDGQAYGKDLGHLHARDHELGHGAFVLYQCFLYFQAVNQ
jgi:hypothetical protein